MKIRGKIAATVIPILILAIIAINVTFGIFFHNHALEHEKSQIQSSEANISTYINERITKYLGAANDWGHWDDTYNYLNNDNPDYIALNLSGSTYDYLDLSFAMLLDTNNAVQYQQFYTPEDGFTDFPSDFRDDVGSIIAFSALADDTYGILKIGSAYYFVASSIVTDSLELTKPNGKLIFGRQIDSGIIGDMEKISGCKVNAISILGNSDQLDGRTEPTIISEDFKAGDKQTVVIGLAVPNAFDTASSVVVSMALSRAAYQAGMTEVLRFIALNTLGLIIVSTLILLLVGKFITKPFASLINDVRAIDITKNEPIRISEKGTDEFLFIRRSINGLLNRIENSQKELVESEEKLRATITSVGDAVITVNRDNKIQFLNPVAQKLTGWKLEEVKDQPLETVFNIINEYTRQPVESPVLAAFKTEGIVELSNHTLLVTKSGLEIPIEDTAAPIKDMNGTIFGCILVFRDFSDHKEKQRRIEYLSFHDQLTGLFNRRFFEGELARIDTEKNLPLSFIYADVNGLKMINDAFGHACGDQLIQHVADACIAECRPDDIISRIGGDEIVILLMNTTAETASHLVDRIAERLSTIRIMDVPISISFGWDTKTDIGQSAIEILKSAENFMYKKKFLNSTSKRSSIIKSIQNSYRAKSPKGDSHSIRVSKLCEQIGSAYDLTPHEIKELSAAGELHDIGKIAVDKAILNKADRLTAAEWDQVKHHPEIGYRLLSATAEFSSIAEYVLEHHERWDGSGYPKGLKGEEISWKARVVAVADAYDVMMNDRPYRTALSEEEAAAELKKKAGIQFDPDIVRVFVEKVLNLEW